MTETSLFADVQDRIAEARARVEALDVSDDVKGAALKQLTRLDRASRYDLSLVSREVSAFIATLDAGDLPLYE
jgi:hypothetical protein